MLTSNNRTLIFIAALLPVPGTSRFFPLYSGVGDKLPPTTDCIPSPVKQMLIRSLGPVSLCLLIEMCVKLSVSYSDSTSA